MRYVVCQPEIAYEKNKSKVLQAHNPPDGSLFAPGSFQVEDETSKFEVFELLADRLIRLWPNTPND